MTHSVNEINLRKLSQLVNPYDKPQEELVRAQVWIDPDDKYLLTSVFPLRGIETALLAGVYKAVCTTLRKENLTSYSPENARRAQEIVTCFLTSLCTPGQGHSQHEQGGVDSVHESHTDAKNVSSNLHQTTSRRRGNIRGLPNGDKAKKSGK